MHSPMINAKTLTEAIAKSGLHKPTAEYVISHVNAIVDTYNAIAASHAPNHEAPVAKSTVKEKEKEQL